MLPPVVLALPLVVRALFVRSPIAAVLVRWGVSFAVAVAVWVLQLPERFFARGTFVVGNSHNVMHFMVLIVYSTLNRGCARLWRAASDVALAHTSRVTYNVGAGRPYSVPHAKQKYRSL